MKKKELRNIAKRIAACEKIIREQTDEAIIEAAKKEIERIIYSSPFDSFEEYDIVDEMVQEFLS